MKRLIGIILAMAFAVFAIVDTIREFAANDTIHYFSQQPHRLLLIAAIGIAGGLAAFGFSALSPRLQRRAKLVALGSGGVFVMLAGGYFAFQFAGLSSELHSGIPRHMPLTLLSCSAVIAGLIWFEFYKILRSHDHLA